MSFRGSRLTLGLLTGLVVVLLIGTGAAIAVSHERKSTVSIASVAVTGSSSSDSPPTGTTRTPRVGTPVSTGSDSTTSANPADTTATDGPSNNLTVQMSPSVARSARSAEVQQLLQGYFDAINQHNYAGWSQLVTGKLAGAQSSAQWLDAYATTVDSSIWMRSVSQDPLQVQVDFTSQQDPDLAPSDLPVDCIDWSITYRLESAADHLLVGPTVPHSVSMKKC